MRLATALYTAFGTAMWANAQITEVTVSGRYYTLRSLEQAGPMYYQPIANGFQLINPDLTLYQTTVYPAIPSFCIHTSGTEYITEALFDQDPSTIEYMKKIQCDTTSGPITDTFFGTLIARMDGTVLLLDTFFAAGGVNGIDLFSSRAPIFNTNLGPRLLLYDQPASGSTRIYALPGTLPCIDCTSEIGMSTPSNVPAGPAVSLFPNPGSNTVVLTVNAPDNESYMVSIYDGTGRLVKNMGKVTGEHFEFSVDGFGPGYYEVLVQDNSGLVVRMLPLVVER